MSIFHIRKVTVCRTHRRFVGICVLLALVGWTATSAPNTLAEPDKKPLQKAKEAGKNLARGVKEIGRDIKKSDAARAVVRMSKDVKAAARDAWKDTLETRQRTLSALREENRKLKRQVAEKRKAQGKNP